MPDDVFYNQTHVAVTIHVYVYLARITNPIPAVPTAIFFIQAGQVTLLSVFQGLAIMQL